MKRTLVLNVVGLTPSLLGEHTPNLSRLAARGRSVPIHTITPAVTCAVQSTYLTGKLPRDHGVVANGWYFRDLAQVALWRQSNALVAGEKLWHIARRRDPHFTVAKLFWWYNMYADVDWAVTPRPIYRANGRKLPDVHTYPSELRDRLQTSLGTFPLFNFWGPRADIVSSRWIAECASRVESDHQPTLNLVYLPHLDYELQRSGPHGAKVPDELRRVDALCGRLIDEAHANDRRVVVLSEYGITEVTRPVHINRALRRAGLISYRIEEGEEHLDPGASAAFAVADHQIAHVYVRDAARIPDVRRVLESLEGIERVLDDAGKRELGLDHARSGELVVIAAKDRWFTYYWWLDDARAPDYARTVDIHSKPGYDPAELFIDPSIRIPPLAVGHRLFRSKVLNQRVLLDVIPLDASMVRGSHGRPTDDPSEGPLFITDTPSLLDGSKLEATEVRDVLLRHVFD
ncbi:MAG: nucleotide pyrophosphatase/phosphodiesterase family protein [Polyangiales bacterium]